MAPRGDVSYSQPFSRPAGIRGSPEGEGELDVCSGGDAGGILGDEAVAVARSARRVSTRAVNTSVRTLAVEYGDRDVLAGSCGRISGDPAEAMRDFYERQQHLPAAVNRSVFGASTGTV